MNENKLELWLSFGKFFLGTFIIGIVTATINWQIQTREIDLKDREIIIKDKEAEFKEMERLGEFVNHALAENVAVRKRFSQYFSTVTRSSELRARWKEYADIVDIEFKNQEKRKKELEELKSKLLKASAKGEVVSAELNAVKTELSVATSNLEIKKNESKKKALPIMLSKTINADMLFNVNEWDNLINIEVLNLYSDLSKNVLDNISEKYNATPEFIKKTYTPKFDEDKRVNISFSIEGINNTDIACWMKNNTEFDELKILDIKSVSGGSILFNFFNFTFNKIIVYYKKKDNRMKVPDTLECK